jgi:hypothetical protein
MGHVVKTGLNYGNPVTAVTTLAGGKTVYDEGYDALENWGQGDGVAIIEKIIATPIPKIV